MRLAVPPAARPWVAAPAAALALLTGCTGESPTGQPQATQSPGIQQTQEPAQSPPTPRLLARENRFNLPKEANNSRPYLSGVWLGSNWNVDSHNGFGDWRGSSVETATAYAAYDTWETMTNDWTIWTFRGFDGTLVYGLPLLPKSGPGSLAQVANGDSDQVWRAVGANLVKHGRGRSIVRIGQEANGTWTRWGASAAAAEDYKAAFRRVQQVLKSVGPDLLIDFDISCGVGLSGSTDRTAPLTELYPGDDVVDVIGCDTYDEADLDVSRGIDFIGQSSHGPGLLDVLSFARQRGKPMAIPEGGLNADLGSGDNPQFVGNMHSFLDTYGSEVLFENYFNEPGTELRSSLWKDVQNPEAAGVYASLWARTPPGQFTRAR